STKFFKGGDEVKNPQFNPGDQLSIEGPEDNGGYLTAVNVYWEKAASAATATSSAKGEKVPDAWADVNPTPPAASGTEAAQPAKRDADDPGPPTLKRGGVTDTSREKSGPVPDTPPPATTGTLAPPTSIPTAQPTLSADNGAGQPARIPTVAPGEEEDSSYKG